MLLKGDVAIRAPRKRVCDFLTDPTQIGQRAPGVEKVEVIEPLKRCRGVVSAGPGSVKARFNGEVLELNEPNHAKLKAHGTATESAADAVSEMSLNDGPLDGRCECFRSIGEPGRAANDTRLAEARGAIL